MSSGVLLPGRTYVSSKVGGAGGIVRSEEFERYR